MGNLNFQIAHYQNLLNILFGPQHYSSDCSENFKALNTVDSIAACLKVKEGTKRKKKKKILYLKLTLQFELIFSEHKPIDKLIYVIAI